MPWIVVNIRWIMIASGVLTATMVYAAIAPEAALASTFGETLDGPLAQVVVRNWGALIALIGAMLVYGAFSPAVRPLTLFVGGASKAVFIGLVLAQGRRYLDDQVAVALAIDGLMIALFAWYLYQSRRTTRPAPAAVL
jgi:membrane associated rhomboid family serine protease